MICVNFLNSVKSAHFISMERRIMFVALLSSSQVPRASAKASAASSSHVSPAPTASPPCPSAWREGRARRRRRRSGRRASRHTACPPWLGPHRPQARHHVSPLSLTRAQNGRFLLSLWWVFGPKRLSSVSSSGAGAPHGLRAARGPGGEPLLVGGDVTHGVLVLTRYRPLPAELHLQAQEAAVGPGGWDDRAGLRWPETRPAPERCLWGSPCWPRHRKPTLIIQIHAHWTVCYH